MIIKQLVSCGELSADIIQNALDDVRGGVFDEVDICICGNDSKPKDVEKKAKDKS